MRRLVGKLRRYVARMLDRWAQRLYSGPEAPLRLTEEVKIFFAINPSASRSDIREFACRAVRNAYDEGFARGYSWKRNGVDLANLGEAIERQLAAEAVPLWVQAPRFESILVDGYDAAHPFGGKSDEHDRFVQHLREIDGTKSVATLEYDPGDPVTHPIYRRR